MFKEKNGSISNRAIEFFSLFLFFKEFRAVKIVCLTTIHVFLKIKS